MIKAMFPVVMLGFFFITTPAHAGPVVNEAEKALLKCMTEATPPACEQAEGAAQTITAVALSSGSSAKDMKCMTDAMELRNSIVELRIGLMTGDSLTAKGVAYKQMAIVKKACARF